MMNNARGCFIIVDRVVSAAYLDKPQASPASGALPLNPAENFHFQAFFFVLLPAPLPLSK